MKLNVLILLVVGAALGASGTILLVSVHIPRVEADCDPAGCADPPCCNGDCNGDGRIDLADAVSVLMYLFAGSSACAESTGHHPCPPCELPATGQTTCYDGAGNVIDCDNVECPGQDGYYQAGYPLDDRYVDNGDGTVTDNLTQLVWQKDTAPGTYDWPQALQYCENLILCNDGTWITDPGIADDHDGAKSDDWRLPNITELMSIMDHGRFPPAIDPIFSGLSTPYWSSTTRVSQPQRAYALPFGSGEGFYFDQPKLEFFINVRAVRSGR